MSCNNDKNLLKINEIEISEINFDIEMTNLKINRFKIEKQALEDRKKLLEPVVDGLKSREEQEIKNSTCP